MWVVAMPIVATIFYSQSTTDFSLFVLAGIVVWALGLFFESVGDFQMARFKADPANQGQVMNRGLWRYTRHPNYFGDFCVWWGIFLVAASTGAWWTIGSPAMMSFFLIKVSGVKLLESDIADRRPGYLEYQRETNAFFPGPPKTPQADA
jgi:steroid 5-alpha reductase family enzyme